MKKSSLSYFLAVLVTMMLSFGVVAVRAQQTQQTDQSDTTTKSKAKSKSKSHSKSADTAASATPAATAAAPTPASKSAPASTITPAAATSPAPSPATAPPSKPAPAPKPATQQRTPVASSAGTVWVNTDSGLYHKPGTRWYGKTKQGKYMTEADAQKAGYRAASKE